NRDRREVRTGTRLLRDLYLRLMRGDPLVGLIFFGLIFIFMVVFAYVGPVIAPLIAGVLKGLVPLLIFAGILIGAIALARINPKYFWRASNAPNRFTHQSMSAQSEFAQRSAAADEARLRAGYQPDDNPDVQLADIGLLVYDGTKNPKICRSSAV